MIRTTQIFHWLEKLMRLLNSGGKIAVKSAFHYPFPNPPPPSQFERNDTLKSPPALKTFQQIPNSIMLLLSPDFNLCQNLYRPLSEDQRVSLVPTLYVLFLISFLI